MHDTVVIGAGPSGSYISYLLAKENYNVLVLDKGREVKDSIICTGIVSKETFQRFPLSKDSILRDINSAKFISPSGEVFRYQHSSPFAHVLDRTTFDSSILKQAIKKGVTFYPQSIVEELRMEKGGVEVLYKRQGELSSIKARTVIIASGVNSSILKETGLKEPVDFLQGAQVEVDFKNLNEVEIYLGSKVAPGSFAWAVPSKEGKARLGLTVRDSASSYLQDFLMTPPIKRRLCNERFKIGSRPVVYGVAPKTYCSRILAVGSIAGQAKTTTGGGIYYGLIGAEMAAQTIVDAFKKSDYSKSHFSLYEKRWRKILEPEIKTGLWLRKVYTNLGDEKIDYLIDLANKDGIAPLIRSKARFDWLKNFFLSLTKTPLVKKTIF